MTKVSQDDLKAFGIAVKRARSLKGWTLDELGAALQPPVGKSLVSKIEKGRKDSLNSRTVGRFINALELDECWIDRFLDTDSTEDADETKAERDADRIMNRITREGANAGNSEELLIELANKYAEGTHRDLETAYIGVRKALEAADAIRKRGEMPAGNSDLQLNAVMAEVAKLNDFGELDQADALLEAEEMRMRADHDALQEKMAEARRQMLEQRLNQDRLRNDPKSAAQRLIADLRMRPDVGKLFWAIDGLSVEWMEGGDKSSDVFALQVAIALARFNWEKNKSKRGLDAAALHTLGWVYLRVAERSTSPRDLELAHNAFEASLKKTSKAKDPQNWSSRQMGFGAVLHVMGSRARDANLLEKAVAANRVALEVVRTNDAVGILNHGWVHLGNALQGLGEINGDPAQVIEAVEALTTALSLTDKQADPLQWELTQNNLALALRWQGALTGDGDLLRQAREGYANCEEVDIRNEAPFIWARLQWNIADLALARHVLDPDPAYLDEAEHHVTIAREVFVDGSDYQTERCDELLEKISTARAAAG